jgi:aspartate aminotransferase-like enzyme
MNKKYLLTPGPTSIPEKVLATLSQPIIHHRTPEFELLFKNVQTKLKKLFGTTHEVLCLAATGTGAMEAAMTNLCSPGEVVITINAGKFGERWTQIAQAYGLGVLEIKVPLGQPFDAQQLSALLDQYPQVKKVFFQASETSTGVILPTQEICRITHSRGVISVCDAITACGVFPLPMDEYNIDVLITGSQKALMIPPGLSMLALSPLAWTHVHESQLPKYYFDLLKEQKTQIKQQTAWTPAISLIQGLDTALDIIFTEGLEAMYAKHARFARATREAIQALGLELLSPYSPSDAVTAVKVPQTLIDKKLGKQIPRLMSDHYGVTITGGQDELEGKIFRLSHFGNCGIFDILTGISCLEFVLAELGYDLTFGQGVGAAMKVLYKS